MVFSLLQPSLWRHTSNALFIFYNELQGFGYMIEMYDLYDQLTCAYSPGPGRRPAGRGRAPAAGPGTAPGSETWPCGPWRSYSW